MRIDVPDHPPGPWLLVPWWLVPWCHVSNVHIRRRNWRWTGDHYGWRCHQYWEYGPRTELLARYRP